MSYITEVIEQTAALDEDLLGERNEIALLEIRAVAHDDLAVAPLDLAHDDFSVDLGDDGGI